ncbi:sigma-70 family RNA polymerase sigma factor [uncultured Pseudoteredinibacter sp.]|uniref:RNA polymerase sigma factor n=1 Tax=uncultured Pseudoteredinibacter sp. TaxID=1641701 RepID=UPI00260516E9|nr:sigma-70 family RNA polymerase sigma factor [uncultured Pseudoteredinibacter sp.]
MTTNPNTQYSSAEIELLVLQAQTGDSESLQKLYYCFAKALERYALLQSSDAELARDACQECWLNCCRKLTQLKDPAAFRAWLFSSLRHRIVDLARNKDAFRRRLERLEQENEIYRCSEEAYEPSLEQEGSLTESTSLPLWSAIRNLPQQERQCIYLFYQEEFSTREIALTLGVSQGTIKSQLSRGRQHLRDALNKASTNVKPNNN